MLLMRPAAAQRVTVFGSTRKSVATSPGVSSLSLTSTEPPRYRLATLASATGHCGTRLSEGTRLGTLTALPQQHVLVASRSRLPSTFSPFPQVER